MQLIDACTDILYFTTVNKDIDFCQFDPQHLQQRYVDMISDAEQKIRDCGISDSQWRNALFALTVWIDESILLSEWPHGNQWQKQSLQRTYFHTANGGEEFYTRLQSLDRSDFEVLELYDVVMSLGFKGALFRDSDIVKRREIMETTMELMSKNRDMSIPTILFGNAYNKGSGIERKSAFKGVLIVRALVLFVPPAIWFLIYLALYSRLSAIADSWIKLF